jgi:hypothetical protein
MFMRYLGGGVGHYQVNVPDAADDEPEPPDEDLLSTSTLAANNSDSEDESSDGEEEDIQNELESNDADDEIALGLEDGEDGMEDLTEDLGYAAL